MDYQTAVARGLKKLENGEMETIWHDTLSSSMGDLPPVYFTTEQGMIIERREKLVSAPSGTVFRIFSGLGGQRGWLMLNTTWRLRGLLDRIVGGVGMRRGRRHPDDIRIGDAIDFWRVVAVEPRHASWYSDDLRALLTEHGVALCLADRRGPLMPPWRTADWGYLRFHAGRARPASCYTEQALASWATATRDRFEPPSTVFACFNNDHSGCALRDAAVFARLLADRAVDVARQPDIPEDVLTMPAGG
jgi:hypothetical protein